MVRLKARVGPDFSASGAELGLKSVSARRFEKVKDSLRRRRGRPIGRISPMTGSSPPRFAVRVAALWSVSLASLLAMGCGVQRTIHITSEPSGALVHLNDEEVGRTPVTVPFKFYGGYSVRLEHEGYATLDTVAEAEAPWWEYPGPDLIAAAMPDAKNRVDWHFVMTEAVPANEQDAEAIVDRARQLRSRLREGE